MSAGVLRKAMDDKSLVVAANSKIDPPSLGSFTNLQIPDMHDPISSLTDGVGSFTNLQIPDMNDPISSLTDGEKCAPVEAKVFDEISQHDEPNLPCHFTALPSEMKPALEDITSEELFDEMLNSCCPTVVVTVQSDAPIKMIDEDATYPESSKVQLFTESPQRDMLVRYVTEPSFDHDPSKWQIEYEIFEDMCIAEFLMEPETIEDIYLDNLFKANEYSIPASYMPSDEMLSDVEHGESTREFNDHYILNRFPFDPGANRRDPKLSSKFMALTSSTEKEEAHTLFEDLRKRGCLFAKLYYWQPVGGVEMGVECSCNFRNSCTSYKLLGESIAHSFLYSFDGAPTYLEEQYMRTQLRYFRSGMMWYHYEIAYLIIVMQWLLMELIRYEEDAARYRCIDLVYKILVPIRRCIGVANSAVLKLHQPSNILALYTNKERWKSKVQANSLKHEKGLQFLNLMEESKFEHRNAHYVIIVDMLDRSSQFVHAGNKGAVANFLVCGGCTNVGVMKQYFKLVADALLVTLRLPISTLLLLVAADHYHLYVIMTQNSCEEIALYCLLSVDNVKQILPQFLLHSNLEDKVLFEAGGIVVNSVSDSVEVIFGNLNNYVWDPG
ncbi:hypothetical protein A4A49_16632 [Nicotiana attenuata]|uniref:Uncharacterized protein n=1 Tax=Nicotiana attenuata TaxID=49451 RepID=A0A1J6IHQ4_NICAT|nr:hypothetical protein A4A49_16632 [Nicotiana attenuata]